MTNNDHHIEPTSFANHITLEFYVDTVALRFGEQRNTTPPRVDFSRRVFVPRSLATWLSVALQKREEEISGPPH